MAMKIPKKLQPPHIKDPREGDAPLDYKGRDTETPGMVMQDDDDEKPPGLSQDDYERPAGVDVGTGNDMREAGAETEWQDDEDEEEEDLSEMFIKRAKDAFAFSTSYMDSNLRQPLDDSLRAFNNQHSASSKYNSETFRRRSHLYRPKTRAVIRKNEAAAAAALFSNFDLINTEPGNPTDKEEIISADVMKQLVQERLTVSIPWFKVAIGGFQDAQVQGTVAAHIYWRFRTRNSKQGHVQVEDRPCIDLIPRENLRVDPSADWMDPLHSSPYLIHLMPMYLCDVKERMEHPDPKGRRWLQLEDSTLLTARCDSDDSTRAARLKGQSQDPSQQDRTISDYDLVWVHRHIHRFEGEDWEFYTLNSEHLLTTPAPLIENVWHGMRPYEIGCAVLETHTTNPSSVPTLTKELQEEANEVQNQRSDNVKFVLNKRWFVKRGKNVDVASLVRNVPGGATMVDDVEKDIKEVTWADVTQSAYLEQDRINSDFDDLAGNFSPTQAAQSRTPRESFRTMSAVQSPASMLTEYMLKTYVESFLLPVLRQVVLLEQFYESDEVMLGIAGEKAKITQRFGQQEITDALLEKKMTVTINIGMGATNPDTKLQRFQGAMQTFAGIAAKPPPAIDLKEVLKELLALSGYRDGQRFMSSDDPDKIKAQQMIQMLMKKITELQLQVKNKSDATQAKIVTAREGNVTKLVLADKEDAHQSRHLLIGHLMKTELADKQAKAQQQAQAQGAEQQGMLQQHQQEGQMAMQKAQPKPAAA
jgi:hypothetical protein